MRILVLAIWLLTFAAAFACDPPPPALTDITANSSYIDAHHSITDPELKAKNVASVKPFEDFGRTVASMAGKPDAASHACALRWLAAWAEGRAMLGKMSSEQAYYERKWTLAALAMNYARVRDAATPEQQKTIDDWLQPLADTVMAHSDAHKGKRNNHYYWEGLAVTATGAVLHNDRDLAWGRKVFGYAMGQIEDDGALPNEMDRARRALAYHLFAAQPLVMMEALLGANDVRLARLVSFCIAGIQDPGIFAARTGIAQDPVKPSDYAWLAVYTRRHPGFVADVPSDRKPPYATRLGGRLDAPHPLEH
jgi:poly(beta-D-mannuronate) lyase